MVNSIRWKRFEFTKEQEQYILDNWGIESPHSMKKKFGCSWDDIARITRYHCSYDESTKRLERRIKPAIRDYVNSKEAHVDFRR